ncbi:MFS transporter [Halomonas sp. LR5S13]|uniref:MFS transporter n=1 Tax=Halomonas rhizosphaerae TaxID=3043296 RepID=UPI0024A97CED|nr:MFS transporter [Halomonas rhizosphaerae]MDI5922866.1 MFS transporter [Halomonas rhizosphaerae]
MKLLRDTRPESWSLVFSAFSAAYGVGLLPLLALPFLISAIIADLGLNEAQAGYLMSAEFLLTMVASLIVAPLMGRAPRRTLALVGALVAILANLGSAMVTEVTTLAILRCVAGAGAGLALACGNACVSSAKDPDNIAGYMNVLFVALMIVVMLVFARTMASSGLSGLYYSLAVTQALMVLFMLKMPQRAAITEAMKQAQSILPNSKMLSAAAVCMMLATFLFSMRDTMGWAFVEQVGIRVGYDGESLGMLFSLQAFVGLAGPLLVTLIGSRFGLSKPVIIGILMCGGSSLGYVLGEASIVMYTTGVMMIAFTYFYTLAYLTSLAASLDREGRVVAACGSFLTLGIAIGPAVSGTLIAIGGYALTGWAIAIAVALTLLAVSVPLSKARERRQAESVAISEGAYTTS